MSSASGPDENEWEFALDEVGEDAEPVQDPIEPQSPSTENVAFVLVGVLLAIVIVLVTIGVVP